MCVWVDVAAQRAVAAIRRLAAVDCVQRLRVQLQTGKTALARTSEPEYTHTLNTSFDLSWITIYIK